MLLLLWALLCVPETRGLSIDQVEQLFQAPVQQGLPAAQPQSGIHSKGKGMDVQRSLLLQ